MKYNYICIRCGNKEVSIPWEEHIKECPTYKKLEERCALYEDREHAIQDLCNYANEHCLEVNETWAYEIVARVMGLTLDDFYNDLDSLSHEARHYYGLSNWIPASKRKVV